MRVAIRSVLALGALTIGLCFSSALVTADEFLADAEDDPTSPAKPRA